MKKQFLLQILFSGLLCPLTLPAQQARDTVAVAEVLIHENRLQIPFNKQNRNMEILSAADIKNLPARSLNEVLSYVQGAQLRQRGPFGTQADINLDGDSFEQTLILLNGVKVNDPQTGHHSLNLPIPLELIERIEVLRGAASRIYGVNALTGAINIITKAIDSTEIMAHIYGGSSLKSVDPEEHKKGMYYSTGIQLGAAMLQGKTGHQLYYTKEQSNGHRYNSAAENDKVYYRGQHNINAQHALDWTGSYLHNNFGANGFYAAPGDKEAQELVQTALAALSSRHQLSERFFVSTRWSNRYNKDDYRYFRHDLSRARSIHDNNVFAVELNSRYHTDIGDLGIGVESRFEHISSSNIGTHKRENHGAFVEFKTERIPRMSVNAGAYINYNSQYGWQVFPGIDMGYLLDRHWRIIFNAGSSQRIPTFTDLYLDQRPGNIGNAALKSENAWQLETALKYNSKTVVAQAGYFYRTINNFIDWIRMEEKSPYQPFNMEDNKTQGLNTSIKLQLPFGSMNYSLSAGYNYLRPTIEDSAGRTSKYVTEGLKHQANVVLAMRQQHWNVALATRYQERLSNKSYLLTDARLGYQAGSIHLYTDVQNIFNVTYIETAAVPMPGRWLNIGLKYAWKKR